MHDEQTTFSDREVLRSAARTLESLADTLRESADGDEALFAYKSGHTANLVATTLREWAYLLEDEDFIESLVKNEAILRMVKPNA